MAKVLITELREMRTVYEDGGWHFKGGQRRDNIGDFTVGVALVGDRRWYVLMARMGTPPPGGAFWYSPYDGDPWTGWTQGAPPGSMPEPPVKALPMPKGAVNIDTHAWVQNPLTGVFTWVHCVKDQTGRSHLERATSSTIDPDPNAYTRWPTDLTTPNTQECSLVIDPWAGEGALFYVRKTQEHPDPYGIRFRSRIYRRTWSLAGFDTDPQLGEAELVFDPPAQGDPGAWGTAYTVLQPGVCILPDRRYLMTALGKIPIGLANGKPAVGQMNATATVGCWVSEKRGVAYSWHAADENPVFSREFLELTRGFGNQVNTPHPFVDHWTGNVYVAMQLNRTGRVNQPGSRLMLCRIAVA